MDESLKIEVPVNSDFIRNVIDKNTANEIIDNIVNIDVININDKLIESEYKRLLHDGCYEGLIKIIKTTYLKNNERINNKKKLVKKMIIILILVKNIYIVNLLLHLVFLMMMLKIMLLKE